MGKFVGRVFLSGFFLFVLAACRRSVPPADLVVRGGTIYTVAPALPRAAYLAVKGNAIVAVGADAKKAGRYIGPATRVIELQGKFAVPGIIDAHVHFDRAGALINDANLMTVSDEAGLRRAVGRVAGERDDEEQS